jgi:acyl-coenzyme A thioesterase PaaI-like protein
MKPFQLSNNEVVGTMEVKTHKIASKKIVGEPIEIKDGSYAIARLLTSEEMVVDEKGLIHGGFTFGLADFTCMLAVNHPNVVLGSSNVKFIGPVKVGDLLESRATITNIDGRKSEVEIEVKVSNRLVLTGIMSCYTLDQHVLQK